MPARGDGAAPLEGSVFMLLEAEQHCGCPDDYAPCLEAAVADALTIFLARFPSARRARGVSADASPNA
ncbi:MAG TPA: hypothetical protein VIQ02_08095, partial [Jiangellaceae bacterium]